MISEIVMMKNFKPTIGSLLGEEDRRLVAVLRRMLASLQLRSQFLARLEHQPMRFRTPFVATRFDAARSVAHLRRPTVLIRLFTINVAHRLAHEVNRYVSGRDARQRNGKTHVPRRHVFRLDPVFRRFRFLRDGLFRFRLFLLRLRADADRRPEHLRPNDVVRQQSHQELPLGHVRRLRSQNVHFHERLDRPQIDLDLPAAPVDFTYRFRRIRFVVQQIRHDEESLDSRPLRVDTDADQPERHRFRDDRPHPLGHPERPRRTLPRHEEVAVLLPLDILSVRKVNQPASMQSRHETDVEMNKHGDQVIGTIISVGDDDFDPRRRSPQLLEKRNEKARLAGSLAPPRTVGDHLDHRGRGGNQHDDPPQRKTQACFLGFRLRIFLLVVRRVLQGKRRAVEFGDFQSANAHVLRDGVLGVLRKRLHEGGRNLDVDLGAGGGVRAGVRGVRIKSVGDAELLNVLDSGLERPLGAGVEHFTQERPKGGGPVEDGMLLMSEIAVGIDEGTSDGFRIKQIVGAVELAGRKDIVEIFGRIRHEALLGSSVEPEGPRSDLKYGYYRARSDFAQQEKQRKSHDPRDPRSNYAPITGKVTFKSADRLKILYWDTSGYAQWYKRLEAGRFRIPVSLVDGAKPVALVSAAQLAMILEGIEPVVVKQRKRFTLKNQAANES